ncbi:phage terminase small subunit [Paenibacillus durus]|uniref:Terminase n=1 Tax=Paenibacillus durus ATCC 35681 TaxID=1333534 RepID=A0A0F7FCM6_PAEDU|nr:phage terminase small subunit [Paenibacillus durus]AKG36100.1 terminase [Paenibacillus durus ATCC 35681]
MGKSRDPRRDEAFEIWKASSGQIDLVEIAAKLGVSDGTLRGWKSKDRWEAKLNGTFQSDERSAPQNSERSKRRGAPKGNKNAVGNRGGAPPGNTNAAGNRGGPGGPPGNKKAVTTGEYETIWLDALDEDEQMLLDRIDTDPIKQADDAIKKLELRERRMLLRIKRLTEGLSEKERRVLRELKAVKDAMTIHDEKTGVTKTVPVIKTEMVESQVEEKTYRSIDDILALEEALTRVQDKKLKAIELKARLLDEEKKTRTKLLKIELERLQGAENNKQFVVIKDDLHE